MYTPGELVAQVGRTAQTADGGFGASDLVRQRGTVAELAQICQAWGSTIASLHTTSTRGGSEPIAARPWVITQRHLTASMRAANGFGYASVFKACESSRDLRAAAREVDERWTEHHWIHGDLNVANVLVEHQPAMRVYFGDLEQAGLGDPAWDLATAVDMITWLAVRWRTAAQPLVDYLLLGYRRASGPARLYPAMQAVRALATAIWVSGALPESTGHAHIQGELPFWLDRAQAYAARVGRLMAVA